LTPGKPGVFSFYNKKKRIMAGLIPLGAVIDPSKDVFPTTGAHLDVRVIPQFGAQKGKKIDPKTARSILQNVLVGPNRTPLVQQQGADWRWNFPVTSGFGPRKAPTAGASTYHQGIDVPLGAGTSLTYKGYGTFRPDSGFGSLMTTDDKGNPYELRFLHTQPGKAASVGSQKVPDAPSLPSVEGTGSSDQLLASYLGTQLQNQSEQGQLLNELVEALGGREKPKTLMEQMKEGLIGGMVKQAMTPTNFLSKFMGEEPYLQGQQYATSQFFGL
jgi:hypothetical protein